MSAPAIALPPSVQRRVKNQDPSQQDVAKLAYALWQERGMPNESAEEDWIEAERQLRGEQPSTLNRVMRARLADSGEVLPVFVQVPRKIFKPS